MKSRNGFWRELKNAMLRVQTDEIQPNSPCLGNRVRCFFVGVEISARRDVICCACRAFWPDEAC